MKRLLVLSVLALLAASHTVGAQLIKIGSGGDGKDQIGSKHNPLPVGPWYLYWPLEAHFQTPAIPQYPFYTGPQTLPITPPSPYGVGRAPVQGWPQSVLNTPAGMGQGGYPAPGGYGYPQGGQGMVAGYPGAGYGMPGAYPQGGYGYQGGYPMAGGYGNPYGMNPYAQRPGMGYPYPGYNPGGLAQGYPQQGGGGLTPTTNPTQGNGFPGQQFGPTGMGYPGMGYPQAQTYPAGMQGR